MIGRFYGALDESARTQDRLRGGCTKRDTRLHFPAQTCLKGIYRTVALLVGFRFSDSQCGIKCFKTDCAKDFSQCKIEFCI